MSSKLRRMCNVKYTARRQLVEVIRRQFRCCAATTVRPREGHRMLDYLSTAAYYYLHTCRLPGIDETTRSQAQALGRAWRAQRASGARARSVVPLWGLLRCAGSGTSQV